MTQSLRDTKNKAFKFIKEYQDAVKENAESQSFLNDFFNIFGISRRRVASFEKPVRIDDKGVKKIDLFWHGVLLVEMKSTGRNLDKAYKQGIDYFKGLKDNELPRFVLVCDLNEFRLFDLDNNKDYQFLLKDLVSNLHLFDFMQGGDVEEITEYDLNEKAAQLLGKLHDELEDSGFTGHHLQVFMVRILFCLFAEDTGVFNRHQFVKYLIKFTDETGIDTELHLHKLFQVLDKNDADRNTNLIDELKEFPYVNGELFAENIDMPSFTANMRDLLLECCYFNWQSISPAIFGSLFQSIMDKEARRNLGAHYTSEENILKLIKPLFLDELYQELKQIAALKQIKTRNKKLIDLTNKIKNLKFLDPACGCGNFLIITYREIRRLELKILKVQQKDKQYGHLSLEIEPEIKLNNFYGIEIDEWPVRIAEVAMWLTQHQMNVEFAKEFGREPDLLPLKEHANIKNANALEIDWGEVVDKQKLNYIIGNPPFVGKAFRTKEQTSSMELVFKNIKGFKNLDFVSSWFLKSAEFAKNTNIDIALVSTNSITMGEQVGTLWQSIIDMGVYINFAHRTFAWHNDAKGKAAVHCVIIGFSHKEKTKKYLFDYADIKGKAKRIIVKNINPYLIDAPSIVITNKTKPICKVNEMMFGNMPNDSGNLLLNNEEQKLLKQNPQLKKWLKPILGSYEFLNNQKRYCLWFTDIGVRELKELMEITEVKTRIEAVKKMRLESSREATKKLAETPWLFGEIRHTEKTYILVPRVSSERREYVPMGFFDKNTICSDANLMIPNATLYEFAILTSQIHMDWMRVIAGRLESRYRYSAKLVYNNFPWPEVTDKKAIEKLAQNILDIRDEEFTKDKKTSLADLYDPDIMPPKLRKAHKNLDIAVDKLYSDKGFNSPLERVKHLFELYKKLQ